MTLRALLLLCAIPATAQTYTPRTIAFTGSSLDPKALTQAAAIPLGHALDDKQINDAMNRLLDTGLFNDIRYTVDDRALTFVLTPQPANLMLPAVYGNFVLFKPAELTPLVHARVPLFNGTIPTSGNLQQSVADALTAILLDRGIHGHVDSLLGQGRAVVFLIAQPAVEIRNVKVDAASAIAAPKLAETLHNFASTPYDRLSADAIHQRLIEAYLDLGFLDAVVDPPVQSDPVLSPPTDPDHIYVDFTAVAHENGQYHIAKLDWPVTPIVKPADFDRTASVKTGDPASRIELLSTTARLEGLFRTKGYLDVKITLADQKDSAAHTIAYTFTAAPGEVYHVRAVKFLNTSAEQQKDCERLWALPTGSPVDESYIATFIARNRNVASFQGYQAKVAVVPNRTDHTADILLTFAKSAPHP